MDAEQQKITELAEQNIKISRALMDIAEAVKKLDMVISVLSEKTAVNTSIIENILKEKLHLSQPEINVLLEEARQNYRQQGQTG